MLRMRAGLATRLIGNGVALIGTQLGGKALRAFLIIQSEPGVILLTKTTRDGATFRVTRVGEPRGLTRIVVIRARKLRTFLARPTEQTKIMMTAPRKGVDKWRRGLAVRPLLKANIDEVNMATTKIRLNGIEVALGSREVVTTKQLARNRNGN